MEIIRLDESNIDTAAARATQVLKKGGIVLFPTDTLYGLAVDAFNRPALEALRELKGREKKKPISIIVPDVDSISSHAELHPKARALADLHLPGALTLVLDGKSHVPQELMLNGKVGVRVPKERFVEKLARTFGLPFTATSANRAGLQTPSNAMGVIDHFGIFADRIDLVIDDGERSGGVGSTVVTFIDEVPYVLREGAISREELGI